MRRSSFFMAILVAIFLPATPGWTQLSTGTITGAVQDPSGAVIPGVTVTLSRPGVIGGNREVLTNERGAYQFPGLVPQTYTVRASLPGFQTAVRQNIIVNADVTVRVNLTLQVGEITDSITVTGTAPLLDTTTALSQAVLDRATLDKLPSGHDLWSIGRTVPGVLISKYDVGGNESFQQSSASVHGSGGDDNKYAIDGMDVAWAGGSGTVMVYFDPNMFEEINYQVGNISAENRQGGVVMNMVTKTGSNDFHGSFMFTGTNESLQSDNISPELNTQLLAAVPSRVLAANPTIRPGQQVLSFFDSAASLSGPVVRDKFWFTMTYKLSSLNQRLLGNYNPDGTQGVDDNRIDNKTFKLSYQVSDSNQLHYTYSRNLKDRYHRRTATYQEDRASRHQDQWADIHQMKWTSTITPRLVMDAGVSLQVGPSPYLPQKEVQKGDLPREDTATGASTFANRTYSSSPQYRGAANVNLSYFAASHDVKVGYQFSRLMLRNQSWSLAEYPWVARYRNGVPQDVVIFNYPVDTRVFSQEHGFFIQDKWSVTGKLTLNLGARLDKVNAWIPEQCQPETVFVSRQCFDEIRDVPSFLDVAPRFAVVYDLFGNGRTAIKASANKYHVGVDSGDPSRVNPYGSASNTVDWNDINGDRMPQLSELGQGSGFNFGSTNRYAEDLKRPFSWEFSAGVQHELPGGIVLAGTYFHRDNRRGYAVTNVGTPFSVYDPIEVTIPQTGEQTTIYNIQRAYRSARDRVYENRSDLGTYFNGVDITVNKRTGNWTTMMGLSLNSEQQRNGLSRDNPNANRFVGGPDGNDVPVTFKLASTYRAPFGFQLASNIQHFTGLPERQTYTITRSLVPQLTNSSLSIDLVRFGTYRLPNTNLVDLSIGREFQVGEQVRIAPKVELFNLLNSSAIQAWSTQLNGSGSSAYHNASRILNPRMVRLGLQMNF
jgi:Carboxypeptidase regulatory-like domain/TonB dependent receptor-like, beta-barrel/TonB-dependent Receptor Plug Domain